MTKWPLKFMATLCCIMCIVITDCHYISEITYGLLTYIAPFPVILNAISPVIKIFL